MNLVSWNCLWLCVCLMGAACAMPSQTSSSVPKIKVGLSLESTATVKALFQSTSRRSKSDRTFRSIPISQGEIAMPPEILTSKDATSRAFPLGKSTWKGSTNRAVWRKNLQNSTAKPAATSAGKDSKVESTKDQVKCLADWKKFLVDFEPHYPTEIETEKRRNVFCDNWRSIKKHNKLFELGLESYDLGINQFSDLTFEEWLIKQTPRIFRDVPFF